MQLQGKTREDNGKGMLSLWQDTDGREPQDHGEREMQDLPESESLTPVSFKV
jgi:hypothetical protein